MVVFLIFSDHLCFFIDLSPVDANFSFWSFVFFPKIKKSKMKDPKWPPLENHDVILTTCHAMWRHQVLRFVVMALKA